MENKPGSTKLIVLMLVVVAIAGIAYYKYSTRPTAEVDNTSVTPVNDSSTQTSTDTNENDTQLAEGEELPADLKAYEGWEEVKGSGFTFMHPGYFIKQENGYYIMAVEPIQGNEFTALAIHFPFETDDIVTYLNKVAADSNASVGSTITKEPTKISVEGTKAAYEMEYEVGSGPNNGLNKVYAYQSPSTDEWVTIQYAEGSERAENIRKSFHFVDQ